MSSQHFHVYILASKSRNNFVKVGKTNNLFRVQGLVDMQYADIADWEQKASFPLTSNHAATALESMINSKLSNQGHKRPRLPWTNKINNRASFADECYSCTCEHAISIANELAEVYQKYVA